MKFLPTIGAALTGSLGGIVASHNRGGTYFRQRAIPVQPGSPQQEFVKATLAQLANLWVNTLTPAQRDAWNTYAENVELPDKKGDLVNIGGLAQYNRSNVPRLNAGLTRIDDAPTTFDLGGFTPIVDQTFTAPDSVSWEFDANDAWVDEDDAGMIIQMSRQQNPSVNFFKGPYRFGHVIEGDATTAPTSPEAFTAPFVAAAGNRVFYQVRVSRADGRLSAPFRSFTLAV